MVVFDVAHVFRVFGGPKGLLTALDDHQPGHGLNYNAVQMWSQRQTIPTKWMGAVLYCVLQRGWNVAEFLTDGDELGSVPHARSRR
jgi:hypothetical protein